MTSSLNNAFMKLTKRAEMNNRAKLVATFVDVGPLFTLLSGRDHQILYGRRGTGKTHALSYLAETVRKESGCAIYIDMRNLGSTGGLYADPNLPLPQRATRLLIDTLSNIHDGLYEYFIDMAEELDLSRTGLLLDRLANALTRVEVVVTTQIETRSAQINDSNRGTKSELSVAPKDFKLSLSNSTENKQNTQVEHRQTDSGVVEYKILFGSIGQIFRDITAILQSRRIWILLDEWSSIPIELHPYLADFLKRSVFPIPGFTVKIAAIEQRSRFQTPSKDGDYLGFELGADISADLNLDDFMVFDNDADRARNFFKELLYKHVKETEEPLTLTSSAELTHQAFTQVNTFDEFVRAAEGVPRDAINIISLAAQKALSERISINHINTAARNWYQRDKEAALRSNNSAHDLLHWIVDEVIGKRRSRAFLLRSNIEHDLVNTLFDARVLHIVK